MSTMQISGKLPFLHGENAAGKAQSGKPNTVTEILNRAVEVYISAKGKSLSESAEMEEDLTPAEAALAANDKELADKKAKKAVECRPKPTPLPDLCRTKNYLSDEIHRTLHKRVERVTAEQTILQECKVNEL